MSMRAGRIAFISTQRGEGNGFNKLVENVRAQKRGYKHYRLHEYRLRDAIAQGYYRRRCVMQGIPYSKRGEQQFFEDCMAEPGAPQEYDCIPARDGEQYFPRELITSCQRKGRVRVALQLKAGWETQGTKESRAEHVRKWCEVNLRPLLERLVTWERHYVGQDFGRSAEGDLSAIAILALRDDKDRKQQIRSVPFIVRKLELFYLHRSLHCGNPLLMTDFEAFALEDSVPVLPKKRTKGLNGAKRHGDAAVAVILAFAASKQPRASIKYVGQVPSSRPRLTAY